MCEIARTAEQHALAARVVRGHHDVGREIEPGDHDVDVSRSPVVERQHGRPEHHRIVGRRQRERLVCLTLPHRREQPDDERRDGQPERLPPTLLGHCDRFGRAHAGATGPATGGERVLPTNCA